jgi:hypothetical protein
MVFENLQVRHKTFGLGTVIATDGKYIKVKFESAEKNFVYPDSFEKFLTLEDGSLTDEILADLAATNERKAKILADKLEENVRAMTHGIVIPGKEGTSENEEEDAYKNNNEAEI